MSELRIADAIDMHCHFGPDEVGTQGPPGTPSVSALQAAQEARDSGHRAIVLKSHSFASPALAANIEEAVPGLRVFGGICTDQPTGGLNVHAVELALRMGAKIVWLPTVHSHQDWLSGKGQALGTVGEGLRTTTAAGTPCEEVRAIAELVKGFGAILATGHIGAEEHYAVARAFARECPVLVTHAGEALAGPALTPGQCRELAELGAIIELTALTCDTVLGHQGKDPKDMAALIRAIGPERCTLATDYGWSQEIPHPAPGLQDFLERLWDHGIGEPELTRMVSANPARLLDLS